MCQGLVLNKLQAGGLEILQIETPVQVFPVSFKKFLRRPFL